MSAKHQPLRDQLRSGRPFFSPVEPFIFSTGPFEEPIRTYACPHCGVQIFDVAHPDRDGGVWLNGHADEDGRVVLFYGRAGIAHAIVFDPAKHVGLRRWTEHKYGREWRNGT